MDLAPSPLLHLPGAVPGSGIDAPVAAHYGSFNKEQRVLEDGEGFVDLSHRGVLRVSGPDRLAWLHSLTTQAFETLQPGTPTAALVLSPQGHVEHAMYGVDDGEAFTAHVEPGRAADLVAFLDSMRFVMRVEVADVTDELAVCWRPAPSGSEAGARAPHPSGSEAGARTPHPPGSEAGARAAHPSGSEVEEVAQRPSRNPSPETTPLTPGKFDVFPRSELTKYAEAAGPACGLWAFEALRIARGEPRMGVDTDDRTIPNEVGWLGSAVHLDKGCYRGQETVARVHNLGRPPRRLTLLHLDGSENRLPEVGAAVLLGDKQVGRVGSSARHHELGPIALALLKRNVAVDATLSADGLPAAQEVIVDPEVGLHVRPMRG